MKKLISNFIHICPDEKFIDSAISLFEEVDKDNHKFLVISKKRTLSYIKAKNISIISPVRIIIYILKNRIAFKNKIVVFHSSPRISKILAQLLHKRTKVVWIGFGYDYYCYQNSINKGMKTFINRLFLKRVNFFSPVLGLEYDIVKKYEPKFSATLLDWNYDVVSDFFKKKQTINGRNILLGNSATPTNNHLDILETLENLEINNERKIIIPLSYGSNEYKNKIISHIKEKHLNTVPLIDFIKIEDYYNLLCSCSHVIMNHTRQQAYGNIIIFLFLGGKIFLRKENPIYNHLINNGFFIHSISKLYAEINEPLEQNKKDINKMLALKYFSREMFLYRTQKFINDIKNE